MKLRFLGVFILFISSHMFDTNTKDTYLYIPINTLAWKMVTNLVTVWCWYTRPCICTRPASLYFPALVVLTYLMYLCNSTIENKRKTKETVKQFESQVNIETWHHVCILRVVNKTSQIIYYKKFLSWFWNKN